MDLFSILRVIWRHKLATLPVILLIFAGAFYVFKVKPPVYNSSSSILLVNPPNPPTAEQVAAHPKLGKINSNNPYVNDGLQTVADVLINVIGSNSSQSALLKQGVDPRYQVALSSDFGNPPVIQVTGVGATAAEAITSANLISQAAVADLYQMQKQQGVNAVYFIKALPVVHADSAQQTISSKLRTLIAILGLGFVLLLVVISIAQAADKRRENSSGSPRSPVRERLSPQEVEPSAPTRSELSENGSSEVLRAKIEASRARTGAGPARWATSRFEHQEQGNAQPEA
jgi:capsular polysaccharide biosynthesis protein